MATEATPIRQAARDLLRSLRNAPRDVGDRFVGPEMRQLLRLRKAYSRPISPEVLMFGDSNMYMYTKADKDRRGMVQMIRSRLGNKAAVHAITGPAYNARIISAFLELVAILPHRPEVVVVPTSIVTPMSVWDRHPTNGHESDAAEIRRAIAAGLPLRHRFRRPDHAAKDAYDRLPAASLIGAQRTYGEHELLLNSTPRTRWQQVVRARAMADYYNAERLESDSPGVARVSALGAQLTGLGLPSVAYIPAVNYELASAALGKGVVEHIRRNADVVEQAYVVGAGESGTVVNAALSSPAGHFMDLLHLRDTGRLQLAGELAEGLRAALGSRVAA